MKSVMFRKVDEDNPDDVTNDGYMIRCMSKGYVRQFNRMAAGG